MWLSRCELFSFFHLFFFFFMPFLSFLSFLCFVCVCLKKIIQSEKNNNQPIKSSACHISFGMLTVRKAGVSEPVDHFFLLFLFLNTDLFLFLLF